MLSAPNGASDAGSLATGRQFESRSRKPVEKALKFYHPAFVDRWCVHTEIWRYKNTHAHHRKFIYPGVSAMGYSELRKFKYCTEQQMAETAEPRVIKGRFTTCELVRREDISKDLIKFWIKPAQPFTFKPGQYCTIGTGGIERPYSIVSSPDEEEIELFIEIVPPPDGNLTPLLYELEVGAELTLRPRAKGIFVLQPQYKHHVLVGTVTGTVPYISILRKFLSDPEWPGGDIAREDYRFHVLEGASYIDELGYEEELTRLANEHDFIEFMPSISRPTEARNDGWKGAQGRINTLVEDYVAGLDVDPVETCVYACGNPQMIEDVGRRFADTDYNFLEERFWKEDD